MKQNTIQNLMKYRVFSLMIIAVSTLAVSVNAKGQTIYPINESIITSVHADDLQTFEKSLDNYRAEHRELGVDLLNTFKDKTSSNLNRCSAAYYLGELHYVEYVDTLAANISLQFDTSHFIFKHLIEIDISKYPAMESLIQIGNPSIPAVIRNLAESDDTQVRQLSLQVLTQIDVDHDIDQLRLQKAIKNESDPQKQARLQAALKALPGADVKP